LDKEKEKKYIWAHAGISSLGHRNSLFHSQSGKISVCFIAATHEKGIIQLKAKCIIDHERRANAKRIPMHNITEEAANVWTKPSAKITDLIEQFKNESTFYAKKVENFYKNFNCGEDEAFKSRQMLKTARIYSEMHPESNYPHVHKYEEIHKNYFLVHT
uniref:ACPS domain-containing protein n=1 Tax=Gongylonema pulchrum TaxID=637853 RepID=A0A183D3P7_9BILA